MIRFVARIYPPCWVLKARIQKHRGKPFSFTISVMGSFTCITQHTGPTALRPNRKTKQLWLSVLLKDTSAATGQAGIRTHILATSELESNALDRSATTLHFHSDLTLFWACQANAFLTLMSRSVEFTQEPRYLKSLTSSFVDGYTLSPRAPVIETSLDS